RLSLRESTFLSRSERRLSDSNSSDNLQESTMKSRMIEFLRDGDPREGTINKGRTYLVTSGTDNSVRSFEMPCGHTDIQRFLARLRYRLSVADQKRALTELSELVTDILQPSVDGNEPIQLDLVVSVAEIGALPFEAATDSDGQQLFVRRDKVVVPTRRIRGEFEEKQRPWPARPRVLFVYANPDWLENAPKVPVREHEEALEAALKPWLELMEHVRGAVVPDATSVLVKKEASLGEVKSAIQQARLHGKPFTHVHILAHGVRFAPDQHLPDNYEYGLALNSELGKPVESDELADAIVSQDSRPVVVSLAVCDGGNQANCAFRVESLAHPVESCPL
ncbi:MAG: CHAT domain-containing protein, partial [Pirellulaceae bacterium]|nr:CHAT domain-containing protein [Pirellulaceae bacterium]